MKKIALVILVGLTITAFFRSGDPDSPLALLKAEIIDKKGTVVWNNDSTQAIQIVGDVPQIILGQDIPLFENYLHEVQAETLRLWINVGNGYEHYTDLSVEELQFTNLEPEFVSTQSIERANRAKTEVKIEGKLDRPENPMERQKWRLLQKGGKYDLEKRSRARAMIERRLKQQQNNHGKRDAGVANWENMGPDNIGGRVRAIAINPQNDKEIYIGAAGGGIWKTEDGGASWNHLDDFLPSLAVTSIVINHEEPSIVFASTGEGQTGVIGQPGEGIFRSTDAGDTWEQLAGTTNYNWINKLAIHPQDPSIIYAAYSTGPDSGPSFGGNIIRTLNGGNTWSFQLINGLSPPLTDIDISSDEPNLIIASGQNTVWRSTDGGSTFVNQVSATTGDIPSGNRRIEVAMDPANVDVVYALVHQDSTSTNPIRCRIYYSDDAGDTWTAGFTDANEVFSSNGFGDYSNMIWVDPKNNKSIYFGGVDLWHSIDNGVTASRISDWTYYHKQTTPDSFSLHADQHIMVADAGYGSSNFSVYVGNDGGIQKIMDLTTVSTYDGYENLVNKSLGITQFYGGSVDRFETVFGGGAQDNSFSTGSAPDNWTQTTTGDGAYMAINYINPDTIYANTNHNRLWMSTDGGATFQQAMYKLAGILPWPLELESEGAYLISPLHMDYQNRHHIWLGGNNLYRYNAHTQILDTFNINVSGEFITAIDVANNGQDVLVGYSGGTVRYSPNGGTTWSGPIEPISVPSAFITDIDIKHDLSQALVTVAGYHTDNVWKITNNQAGGLFSSGTWIDISMQIPLQTNTVTHHPLFDDWIYIGTDLGIFSSEDNGNTWSITPLYGSAGDKHGNDGPIYTEVTDLFWSGYQTAIAPAMKLWAATFGRGLWRSNPILNKIYVDHVNGSDNNSGTWLGPFKTLKKASQEAGSGAIIHFVQGNNNNQGSHEETQNILLDKRVLFELNNGPVFIE